MANCCIFVATIDTKQAEIKRFNKISFILFSNLETKLNCKIIDFIYLKI